jgi:peptidoglycan/LPS O-acetylase OafA/YrhL
MLGMRDRSRASQNHILGLDHLRMLAAIWVTWSHLPGFLPLSQIPNHSWPWLLVRGVYASLINGQAAVFVFFVISGFCIHLKQASGHPLEWKPFLAQRLLRLLLPLIPIIPLAIAMEWSPLMIRSVSFAWSHESMAHSIQAGNSILWSLVCEAVYYLLYPLLLQMARRWGWHRVACLAAVPALVIIWAFPEAKDLPNFGHLLTWIVGFPAWIAGCVLAEDWQLPSPPSRAKLWAWRMGLWGFSMATVILRFHAPFGFAWNGLGLSLNVFAWACLPWIRMELAAAKESSKTSVLERIGGATYSLYLTHLVGVYIAIAVTRRLPLTDGKRVWFQWALAVVLVAAVAWAYYRLIEKPTHRLARYAGRLLSSKDTIPAQS